MNTFLIPELSNKKIKTKKIKKNYYKIITKLKRIITKKY
jgi:hypothetical protein